ncbi:RISC-loading complex subunit TARBP2-like [Athalia rosae]|uniref:RISC-loading complex subunit TARBP2-like n=1 Tax=Athalia rosae TaxID=37344 RepID=UPI00203406AB|nr:RISC-loading complex subunit TARBP2-like [Athalia rosae]
MSKTPISILQEMMVKKSMVPNYELIHNGGGTHLNTFTYQVSCNGLSATGTGRCKKDAKHEAAKAMLETIATVNRYPQLPASPAQSPKHEPIPTTDPTAAKPPLNQPFINAIGALQEICTENSLKDPVYESISDVGPPHAKVFTIHCLVSTFREEGRAGTKKQAKHEAARKMLARITDLVFDKAMDIEIIKKEEVEDCDTTDFAKTCYPQLTKLPILKKANLGVDLSEYHTYFKKTLDETTRMEGLSKLEDLINQSKLNPESEVAYEPMFARFQGVLQILNIKLEKISLTTKGGSGSVEGISLDTSPALIELGYAENPTKARISALTRAINSLYQLIL